jgi:hypothetical protein
MHTSKLGISGMLSYRLDLETEVECEGIHKLVAQATCSRWFLARGFFYPEDGGDTFLRNVCSHKNYKTVFFMVTAVKISDLNIVDARYPIYSPFLESYRLCIGLRNWKSGQGPKGYRAIGRWVGR